MKDPDTYLAGCAMARNDPALLEHLAGARPAVHPTAESARRQLPALLQRKNAAAGGCRHLRQAKPFRQAWWRRLFACWRFSRPAAARRFKLVVFGGRLE